MQSPACMLPDRSPPFKHFWSKQKSEHDLSSEEKNTEKKQILTENYFDRSKSRNCYISDSIYFFKFCFVKRGSCFMIFLRSDFRDTRFQGLTTIPL